MKAALMPSIESGARMIAMGGSALMEGFALIGFETWPNADVADVEHLFAELLSKQQQAIVLLEPDLSRSDCPSLNLARKKGGRIIVTEVPLLHAPGDYHPLVEDLVTEVLGPMALETEDES